MYHHQLLFHLTRYTSIFVHFFYLIFIFHSSPSPLSHPLSLVLPQRKLKMMEEGEAEFGSSFPPDKSRKSISNEHVSFRKQFIKQMRWGFPWRRAPKFFAFRLMMMLMIMEVCGDDDEDFRWPRCWWWRSGVTTMKVCGEDFDDLWVVMIGCDDEDIQKLWWYYVMTLMTLRG